MGGREICVALGSFDLLSEGRVCVQRLPEDSVYSCKIRRRRDDDSVAMILDCRHLGESFEALRGKTTFVNSIRSPSLVRSITIV